MAQLHFFEAVARVGLVALVNGLWQGAAIALVAWLALTVFRGANASTRYAVWSLTLVCIVVIPIVTTFSRVSVVTSAPHATARPASRSIESAGHPSKKRVAAPGESARLRETGSSFSLPRFALPAFRLPVSGVAVAAAFALWLVAVLVMLARLVAAFVILERLKRDSLPLAVEYRDGMPRWSAATKGERDIRICVSEGTDVPVAIGLFDAMILLPSHLVEALSPEEVDQVSLHELGHLLRGDDWTNAFQRVAAALLFFNPAVRFVARQLDVEREVACDDFVLQSTGAVRPYASCLAKMAEMTAWPHAPLAAPGVFVTRKSISIRIERLLRTGRAIGSQIAPKAASAALVAMIAIFFILNTLTPSVAYTVAAPRVVAEASPTPAPATRHVAMTNPTPTAHPAPAARPARTMRPSPAAPSRDSKAIDVHVPAINIRAPMVAFTIPPINLKVPSVNASVSRKGTNFECGGCNFASSDLRGRDFSGQILTGANFAHADLQGARFDRAQLSGVNFEHADLRNASFVNANMTGCNLDRALTEGAVFTGATLEGCNVRTSRLAPEQVRAFLATCVGCSFEGVDLRDQDLRDLHVVGVTLAHANLSGADLAGSSFIGVDFDGAVFSGARLNGTTFSGCDFKHADLRNVDLSKASMTGSSFDGALMHG
jgi:uncharacterized protein YjbI with pentapeptide repeats/beta-lactamase regulating signal transducer with metallopeptidase domain